MTKRTVRLGRLAIFGAGCVALACAIGFYATRVEGNSGRASTTPARPDVIAVRIYAEWCGACAKSDKVFAIGVNCTPPQFVESLICEIRSATQKPIVVYPNSGERYENGDRHGKPADFAALAKRWRAAGAEHIGGCCRTGPDHIRLLVGARMP